MNVFTASKNCSTVDPTDPNNSQTQVYVQLALSLALGVSAFLSFSILRPRWKSLYAARKQQRDAAVALPELPDTFFGWMPALYKVTEQQVLASAGLDAYVFLTFFKMSIKLFGIMLLLAAGILAPINKHFENDADANIPPSAMLQMTLHAADLDSAHVGVSWKEKYPNTSYTWAYLFFTYLFTGLALYFITVETSKVIKLRQDYLGSQSTVTDRTIQLSGIPKELRDEAKIKELLEKLEIGKVTSVTLCRDWGYLDGLIEYRKYVLRKLEEAYTAHNSARKDVVEDAARQQPHQNPSESRDDDEERGEGDDLLEGVTRSERDDKPRPTARIWYGFLKLQSKKVDAIDLYEEKLRNLDEKIKDARKKSYNPTPLAFVTMDSIPACQMAVQAVLDSEPMQLLSKLAPAPTDIVWTNTYLPRSNRMIRSWIITIFILLLTIFWLIPVAALAGLLDLCSIRQILPELANLLEDHSILKALVQTGLPTLVVSLLNVAVPFLYDYLANMQGMISQGDVELSVISKNFFFTFFNVFLVFTAFGTASKFWPVLRESLRDTTKLAYRLATSVTQLAVFYTNFILLQGVGLLPFRLLEFGSVSLYPIMAMSAKTPRDYSDLKQPPIFKYGFYLPSAILIWILCMVYSILPGGYMVLLFGLIYFILGYYTYKYQLLYAMDHPQHSTGRAWPMICYRLLLGLGVFQLVMAGLVALNNAFTPAALIVPLIPFTIWYSYYYARTFEPLTKFIALRSIRRGSDPDINIADENLGIGRPPGHLRRQSTTLDESREKGLKFVNPSLVTSLEKPWLNKSNGAINGGHATSEGLAETTDREESAASSVSLGDAHIWRENGEENV